MPAFTKRYTVSKTAIGCIVLFALGVTQVDALAFSICLNGSHDSTEMRWTGGGLFASSARAASQCEKEVEQVTKVECASDKPFENSVFYRRDGSVATGQARSDAIADYCEGASQAETGGGASASLYWYMNRPFIAACMNKRGFTWEEVPVKVCNPLLNIIR